jgi:hypothetical protein
MSVNIILIFNSILYFFEIEKKKFFHLNEKNLISVSKYISSLLKLNSLELLFKI